MKCCFVLLTALLLAVVVPAFAESMDPLTLTPVTSGQAKITLDVTAGPSGAPAGITVQCIKLDDYQAIGGWPQTSDTRLMSVVYTGVPTLNTEGGTITSFALGSNQSITIAIGNLFDETGVAGQNALNELQPATLYLVRGFANGEGAVAPSVPSVGVTTTTLFQDCTYSYGYWKEHAEAWPAANLTIGSVNYTKAQLILILDQKAGGNGLISLAHQLIAAKLSILNGANDSAVASTIATADALIGNLIIPPVGSGSIKPGVTGQYTQTLDDYAQGVIGPGHCQVVPTRSSTWGQIKSLYR